MQKRIYTQLIILLLLFCTVTGCSRDIAPSPAGIQPAEHLTEATVTETTAPVFTSSETQIIENGRIQFEPDAAQWSTSGDLPPMTTRHFILSVSKGQQLNIWLSTNPDSEDGSAAYLKIMDGNGNALTDTPQMFFSHVLEKSSDYTIEVISASAHSNSYSLKIEIPPAVIDPALGKQYSPLDASICQSIRERVAQDLAVDVNLETRAPFLDEIAGEAGQGCRLTAAGDGNKFDDPQSILKTLIESTGLGWNEQPDYRADGPTGSAAALTRDMALMLIEAYWEPAAGADCPIAQPVSECNLTPEQKLYTLQIDIAQYLATFSLDGHWEDAETGFTLNLGQEWKIIYGGHTIVAQGGNKIDSLDASISGMVKGQGADIQFTSSFTPNPGTARLTIIDPNTMTWKIITPPDGEYYLPSEATLVRK